MLHHPQGCLRVASTVLMDPVVFLLCDPTVATSFIYKDPRTTMDFMTHFFVARELFIANALSRNFNWSHNILFIEELSATDEADTCSYASRAKTTSTGTIDNTCQTSSKSLSEGSTKH